MVFFLGHGLVKDLCLLEANLKAKELSSICKGGFDLLQSSFCVGNNGVDDVGRRNPHHPGLEWRA